MNLTRFGTINVGDTREVWARKPGDTPRFIGNVVRLRHKRWQPVGMVATFETLTQAENALMEGYAENR